MSKKIDPGTVGARQATAMQINRCAALHVSMLAQTEELRHECDVQARALVRADARITAAAHLPLRHHAGLPRTNRGEAR